MIDKSGWGDGPWQHGPDRTTPLVMQP